MVENIAFLDTNVLLQVLGSSLRGKRAKILETLDNAHFKIYTFAKCIYELYSILKGSTKKGLKKKNFPLNDLLPKELNDIGQKIFKGLPDVNPIGNSYFWFNLCEEWQGWDYFCNSYNHIKQFVASDQQDEALKYLEIQKQFVQWKQQLTSAFKKIDDLIIENGIIVCAYNQVYSSPWYSQEGFSLEQELATNSLIPNEDFEIILAALFLNARVFITEDDKKLLWRGGLSIDLNLPAFSFCCPERLDEAIIENFMLKFYKKSNNS